MPFIESKKNRKFDAARDQRSYKKAFYLKIKSYLA